MIQLHETRLFSQIESPTSNPKFSIIEFWENDEGWKATEMWVFVDADIQSITLKMIKKAIEEALKDNTTANFLLDGVPKAKASRFFERMFEAGYKSLEL